MAAAENDEGLLVGEIAPMLRERLLAYAMATWHGYRPADHHRVIAAKLEAVERGEIKRLMIFMPPRHGKTALASEYFPAWYLGRNADKQIIHTTYAQEFADDLGMKVRNQLMDPLYQEIFPGVGLDMTSRAASRFNTSNGGVYRAVGAGGPITGRGAHCVVEGTLVQTEAGPVPIDALAMGGASGRILTWNAEHERHEYKDLQAVSHRQAVGLYRITTAGGRVLEVTGNHRIYVDGQYRRADQLSAGDRVLCVLPEGSDQAGLCGDEAPAAREQGSLLRQSVFRSAPRGQESEAVREVRQACGKRRRDAGRPVLQVLPTPARGSQAGSSGRHADMSDLQCQVQGGMARKRRGGLRAVLREALRGDRAFPTNVGQGEPQVETRGDALARATAFCAGLSRNAQACARKGWAAVRGVWGNGRQAGSSPHRQLADEQCRGESGDAVLFLSSEVARGDGLKTAEDTVAVVERLHQTTTVYDIQVADNHNFFAGGILVHNCLLIDDPIKGREDADSETMRRRLKDWYSSVAYTRLMPGGAVVIIQTRWHQDDLSGWLLKEHSHENWEVLSLPAVNPRGEALWPEAYPIERLRTIRKAVGERDWAALYQQSPTVDGGNILKKQWWRVWPKKTPLPVCDHVFLSWDTAYSDKDFKANSHSAATAWGVFWNEREQRNCLMLLRTWNGQVDYPKLRKQAKELDRELEPDCHLIEKKASGQSLIQDMRRIPGVRVRSYQPDRDKVTRAYSVQAMLESGQVWVPERQWAESFVEMVSQFPNGAPPSSDYTDTATQAMLYLRNGWWIEHPDDKLPKPDVDAAANDEWDEEQAPRRRLYG